MVTKEQISRIMDKLPILWMLKHKMRTESGQIMEFNNHKFMWDIYNDMSPQLVCMKAAQITFSTMAIFKTLWLAAHKKLDIIYSLPTDGDIGQFVGGKVNRIIQNNPILREYTKDKDSVEQKQIKENMIYYRGTWTNRAALMTSADLYVADEVDRSKMAVVDQYASRLQHSNYKWQWRFSNPSVVGHGVSEQWEKSDQMHWFITCGICKSKQYMSWPDSFDIKGERYVCKACNCTIEPDWIRNGEWVAKYPNGREWRGYWIPLWIYSVVPAKEIIGYHKDKTPEYFANFVAGLPYVGEGNNIPPDLIWRNLTDEVNDQENVVIGCDSGIKKHYVLGNSKGLFYYGVTEDWEDIARYLKRYPRSILVVDALPDITGPRMLQERFPARVFLNHYSADRKAQQLIRWGQNDEFGSVLSDRNRVIQLLIDQYADMRIPLQGTKDDWSDYYSQLKSSYKVTEKNAAGMPVIRWESDGNDHYLHATVYWLIGMDRQGGMGEASIIEIGKDGLSGIQNTHYIDPLTETYKLK